MKGGALSDYLLEDVFLKLSEFFRFFLDLLEKGTVANERP